MKNFLVVLAVITCLFSVSLEAATQKKRGSAQTAVKKRGSTQTTVNTERKLLLENCRILSARVNEEFSSAYQSSGRINTIKMVITNYLISVGTVTANQILGELKANDFKVFTG